MSLHSYRGRDIDVTLGPLANGTFCIRFIGVWSERHIRHTELYVHGDLAAATFPTEDAAIARACREASRIIDRGSV